MTSRRFARSRSIPAAALSFRSAARARRGSEGPNQINREDVQRRIYVAANVSGRDLVGAVNELRQKIDEQVELPPGYYITYGGQFESQAAASRLIAFLSVFSLVGMFVVLYAHFKSATFAVQIMLNIPMALIGSIAGIWLMGGTMSIATLVGLITLAGIAARNGIMMISHYLHLMKEEGEKFTKEMIVRGTQERLVPVLMTALTAGLALVPLILAAGEPGREILHPVAVVIFSGIFTSTLLDFLVTPLVFWRFGRHAAERAVRKTSAARLDDFTPTPNRSRCCRPEQLEAPHRPYPLTYEKIIDQDHRLYRACRCGASVLNRICA
jgi:Cu/Ag efflux pump CusA